MGYDLLQEYHIVYTHRQCICVIASGLQVCTQWYCLQFLFYGGLCCCGVFIFHSHPCIQLLRQHQPISSYWFWQSMRIVSAFVKVKCSGVFLYLPLWEFQRTESSSMCHLINGNALYRYLLVIFNPVLYLKLHLAQCMLEINWHEPSLQSFLSDSLWCGIKQICLVCQHVHTACDTVLVITLAFCLIWSISHKGKILLCRHPSVIVCHYPKRINRSVAHCCIRYYQFPTFCLRQGQVWDGLGAAISPIGIGWKHPSTYSECFFC